MSFRQIGGMNKYSKNNIINNEYNSNGTFKNDVVGDINIKVDKDIYVGNNLYVANKIDANIIESNLLQSKDVIISNNGYVNKDLYIDGQIYLINRVDSSGEEITISIESNTERISKNEQDIAELHVNLITDTIVSNNLRVNDDGVIIGNLFVDGNLLLTNGQISETGEYVYDTAYDFVEKINNNISDISSNLNTIKSIMNINDSQDFSINDITNKLSQQDTSLNELKYNLDQHDESLNELKYNLDQHDESLNELKYSISENDTCLNELKLELTTQGEQILGIDLSINDIKYQLSEQDTSLNELKYVQSLFDESLNNLQGNIISNSNLINIQNTVITQQQDEITRLDNNMNDLNEKVLKNDLSLNELTNISNSLIEENIRLDTISRNNIDLANQNTSRITSLQSITTGNSTLLELHNTSINSLDNKVARLENDNNEKTDELENNIEINKANIEGLKEDITTASLTVNGSSFFNGEMRVTNNIIVPSDHTLFTNDSVVNKSYVDALASGISIKKSCICATTSNISSFDNPGEYINGVWKIDDVSLNDGFRVLVKDQTTKSENGIYIYSTDLNRLVRADDMAVNDLTSSSTVFVTFGTINTKTVFTQESTAIIGVDPVIFIEFYTIETTFTDLNLFNLTINGTLKVNKFQTFSDYRIKNNIQKLDNTFSVDKLNPVIYDKINTTSKEIGLIAHEVQEEYPYLVEGDKDGQDMQAVNYMGIIGILIKEVQDLKSEVSNLKQLLHNL